MVLTCDGCDGLVLRHDGQVISRRSSWSSRPCNGYSLISLIGSNFKYNTHNQFVTWYREVHANLIPFRGDYDKVMIGCGTLQRGVKPKSTVTTLL